MLVGLGWYVTRSAGSHGPADLVAVAPSRIRTAGYPHDDEQVPTASLVLFVQAKLGGPGRVSPGEWNGLLETARHYGGLAVIAHRPERGNVQFLRVTGEKPDRGKRGPAPPCLVWSPWKIYVDRGGLTG